MKKRLMKILVLELVIILILCFAVLINNEFKFKSLITKPLDVESLVDSYGSKGRQNHECKEKISIYEILKKGLFEGKSSIRIDENLLGENREKIFDIVEEVLLENPDILYYTGGKYYNGVFTPKYSKPIKKKTVHQKLVREKRDKVISDIIHNNMSQYEKVKAIHDYIVNNTKYATEHLEGKEIPDESHTVYGVLIKGKAVCEGYAKTMKFLLDDINVETTIVVGSANGENHAWNIVNIDGAYYHIDATWNDPVTRDGIDNIIYDYFNLKDEDIATTHGWDKDKYPSCNSDKYNYYHYNGLVALNYAEFYSKIESAMLDHKSEIILKVPSYDEKVYNIPFIIEKIAKNSPREINIRQYAYNINKNQNIIRIYFSN